MPVEALSRFNGVNLMCQELPELLHSLGLLWRGTDLHTIQHNNWIMNTLYQASPSTAPGSPPPMHALGSVLVADHFGHSNCNHKPPELPRRLQHQAFPYLSLRLR